MNKINNTNIIKDILHTIRLTQWIKNLFIFAPLIFALKFTDAGNIILILVAFFSFCFFSSANYIFNDLIDKERDTHHPVKKNRPIPGGRISVVAASCIAIVLLIVAFTLALNLSRYFIVLLLGYGMLNILYSFYFKHVVILDVMSIAIGFVLRVFAGSVAIGVTTSNWILLTTLFISLFIGFGKRRNELYVMQEAHRHRPVLQYYSNKLLDSMLAITATLTVITYSLYVVDAGIIARLHTDKLVYTVPFVLYGILKYLYVIYNLHKGGDPSDVVLNDRSILTAIILWGAAILAVLFTSNYTITVF